MAGIIDDDFGDGDLSAKTTTPAAGNTSNSNLDPSANLGGRRTNAPDLSVFNLFRSRSRFLSLSPEGNVFYETLKKCGQEEGFKFETVKGTQAKMDCILITHPSDKCGFLLGFSETVQEKVELPAAYHFLDVKKSIASQRPNLDILNSIVVGPEDYPRVNIFYSCISDHFDNYLSMASASVTIKQFRNYEIVVKSNDFNAVENIFRVKYPHAVPPRMDVATSVRIVPTSLMKTEESVPMAIMTGYTDFVGKRPGIFDDRPTKFNPLFHMALFSEVNDGAIFAFVIAPLIDIYIKNFEWWKTFDCYGPDDINAGCLVPTEKGGITPWRAADKEQLKEFFSKYMNMNALPVLDVFGGKMQLPLVQYLATDEAGLIQLMQRLASFFCVEDYTQIPVPILNYNISNYAGVIQSGDGHMVDSAKVDYLFLANKTNTISGLDVWLEYYDDATRAKTLNDLYKNKFENRYYNFMKVVNPAFVEWVADRLAAEGITVSYDGVKFDRSLSGGKFSDEMFTNWKMQNFTSPQKTGGFSGLGITKFTY